MGFTKEDTNKQAASGCRKLTSFFGKPKEPVKPEKENCDNHELKDHAVEEATPHGCKGEYLGTAKLKTVLERANREAGRRLAASEEPPTLAEVEALLLTMGNEWPTQARPNVTDRKDGAVPGMCLGLVHALGGQGMKVCELSRLFLKASPA